MMERMVDLPAAPERASAVMRQPALFFVALFVGALFLFAVEGVGRFAESREVARLEDEARLALPLAASALRAEIARQRTVPLVLVQESGVRAALRSHAAEELAAVSEKLARLAADTGASVLYIIDADGIAVAASNHAEPDSFVGNDYRFRHYFREALATGHAEQYALGTLSRRPGLYISERIGPADAPLGVVVAKVEFTTVEGEWARTERPTYVTDADDVVLATSVASWRFLADREIADQEAAAIRVRLQSGEAPLTPLPFAAAARYGLVRAAVDGLSARRFIPVSQPLRGGPNGWIIHALAPADRAVRQQGAVARLLAGLTFMLLSGAAFWSWRRRVALKRTAAELETRVMERTAQLTRANARMEAEIAERIEAEGRLMNLRDELAEANRLATLGQIAAGVAHEINQPLAAIRTYAENAGRFLDHGKIDKAGGNMGAVVELTGRIEAITGTLRSAARRPPEHRRHMDLRTAVEGALLMLASRTREEGVLIRVRDAAGPLTVDADRIRLEQVLVNLLRNALDALSGRDDPVISVHMESEARRIRLSIRDNGPGISPDALARLFIPFSTSKPNGLGLGLVISQDIVTEMGGSLSASNHEAGGALFTLELPKAAP